MRRHVLSFFKRCDGAIAVEFAFVAPVMVAMFFGVTELAQALGARGDVTNLASTGADLIAQESSVTTTDMTNVFAALSDMLYPYPTAAAQITISSVMELHPGRNRAHRGQHLYLSHRGAGCDHFRQWGQRDHGRGDL